MTAPVLPGLLRSLARVRVRGVPRVLSELSRFTLGTEPGLRRVASGFRVHIDPTDKDQCMMYYGLYGRGLVHFAEQILAPGDTVFDVGSQIGYFAHEFARIVGPSGRVVAFEPDPRVWPRLVAGIEANEGLRIEPRNAAVSDTTGDATLHVSPTAGWSTLLECDYPEIETVPVATHALDDLVGQEDLGWERLSLIKIDVEGSELRALEGMRETVARFEPHLVCEMNEPCLRDSGHAPDELIAKLHELDYTVQAILEPRGLFRAGDPDLLDVNSARDLPWSVGDLLCTPRGNL